ncbi:MAG TPA: SDR family oxidoreductase [Polyangiaceae bacterium]|nr:SDR family oxidoreductase [Polyangiaceae bacterium]
MHIFVTGASGFVGSAVVRELLGAGHTVLGLAHSDEGALRVKALGADVHRGAIEDLASLERGARASDAVIHTAFNHHDYSVFAQSCENDARAIEAIGGALAGTPHPFIVTSAVGVLQKGGVADENTALSQHPRAATERAVNAVAARGVRVSIVRLPVSVHGDGDPNFVTALIRIARQKRASVYLEDGSNRWPAVHVLDAARAFRLAVARPLPSGTRLHAVAEQGIAFLDLATAIGRRLNVPVVSKPRSEGVDHFGGFLANFAGMDIAASSAHTRDALGWAPDHAGLIADLEQSHHYFAS